MNIQWLIMMSLYQIINLYHYIIPLLYHDSPWLSHDSPINETIHWQFHDISGNSRIRKNGGTVSTICLAIFVGYIPWTIALTQAMISRLRRLGLGSVEAHWDVGLLDRSRGKAKKPADWWADEWYFKGVEWWRSMVIDDDQWWFFSGRLIVIQWDFMVIHGELTGVSESLWWLLMINCDFMVV